VKDAFAVQQATELLDNLSKEMRKAAKDPDPDAIHDVRVAIRRLRQCLDVFSAVFPDRAAQRIDKQLAKVLDGAGELRNLDIAIELLKESRLPRSAGLIRRIRADRTKAGKEFARTLAKLDDGGVAKKWRAKLSKSSGRDPAVMAQKILPSLASGFFDAGQAAADPAAKPKAMHKFRIRAKKFRYTLELFAPLYGPALDPQLRALRTVQKHLGAINDCVATNDLLDEYRKHDETVVKDATKRLLQNAVSKTSSFRRYWHKTLGPEQKTVWVEILKTKQIT
jgi:CHAD domain-containing protein